MLRRLETMVLMTGYELPLRAIREQIASAVDLIVHTARLKDGSRKIVNITEVYGIEDDEILTQDIFAFEQTGVVDGKIQGELKPTGIRPTFMGQFTGAGIELPPGEYGIPPEDPAQADPAASKGRFGRRTPRTTADAVRPAARPRQGGHGRRHGLRLVDRPDRSRDRPASSAAGSRSRPASACANLKATLEAAGQLARQGRLGELVAARPDRVRHLQRGVGRWFPGDAPGRPVHADAAAPAPGRLPRLDRGHRRGSGGHPRRRH